MFCGKESALRYARARVRNGGRHASGRSRANHADLIAQQREADFHNRWASSTRIDEVLVRECFEAPTALEKRFILRRLGPLQGKKLLDIGAGLGESSVYFALKGARVRAVDVSPLMVETALAVDPTLTRVPIVRWLAWNMVMWGEKRPADSTARIRNPGHR
jgi:2-polyprenyl-3-methyl-5-hydroxy-6-metoxy-1,4-benzoquinol methylase